MNKDEWKRYNHKIVTGLGLSFSPEQSLDLVDNYRDVIKALLDVESDLTNDDPYSVVHDFNILNNQIRSYGDLFSGFANDQIKKWRY